jgi:hypothetical protein
MTPHPRTFSEGYYGTSLERAQTIAADNAFEYHRQTRQRVCLAPLDNLDLAKSYGIGMARMSGDNQFGVVHAEFLPVRAEIGSHGEEQIEIEPAYVVGMRVVNLLIFDTRESGLIAPRQRRSELY